MWEAFLLISMQRFRLLPDKQGMTCLKARMTYLRASTGYTTSVSNA